MRALLKVHFYYIFLMQLNNGNLVMSFVAQILSIRIKENNLFSGVCFVLFFYVCLKIQWLEMLFAHITKCRQVFCM